MNLFILDVDGVMTTGEFFYSSEGKLLKSFGPDDSDALSLLRNYIKIEFVTGDKKGFNISKKRITDDMGYELNLVSTIKRKEWIEKKYPLEKVIYMGDGIFDFLVMNEVGYSIAPSNADKNAIEVADYITKRTGGKRAVSEACLHILEKFFGVKSINQAINSNKELNTGEWTIC
tara:strand:- start:7863 stop:8384 length:522 start_codon:yes stop_codon:yes gene_type:complete